MDQGPRFPRVAEKAGHYESFYVKACRPGGGRGIWIRYTVHKRPGEEPKGSIWLTLFDREADGPRATKITVPAAELAAPDGGWIRVAGGELGPGHAHGAAGDFSWELSFEGDAEPCRYLPAEWLYAAPLPRTKFVAPYPNARFRGRLQAGEETIELDGWPGMIGHNWGSEHAERWVWLEGAGFEDAPDTYFDVGAARVALGPWTTPWIAAGMLMLEGEPHRLGGLGRVRSASVEEGAGACSFVLPGADVLVRGTASAPSKDFVGWVYADPDGPEHNTINCSVADLELTVERPAKPALRLSLPGGAAYELGMRETDHGIPMQAFPDG